MGQNWQETQKDKRSLFFIKPKKRQDVQQQPVLTAFPCWKQALKEGGNQHFHFNVFNTIKPLMSLRPSVKD